MSKITVKDIVIHEDTRTLRAKVNVSNDTLGYRPFVNQLTSIEEFHEYVKFFMKQILEQEYHILKSDDNKFMHSFCRAYYLANLKENVTNTNQKNSFKEKLCKDDKTLNILYEIFLREMTKKKVESKVYLTDGKNQLSIERNNVYLTYRNPTILSSHAFKTFLLSDTFFYIQRKE